MAQDRGTWKRFAKHVENMSQGSDPPPGLPCFSEEYKAMALELASDPMWLAEEQARRESNP
eukprot:7838528-Alexandrium_andersonii.AAC.1